MVCFVVARRGNPRGGYPPVKWRSGSGEYEECTSKPTSTSGRYATAVAVHSSLVVGFVAGVSAHRFKFGFN